MKRSDEEELEEVESDFDQEYLNEEIAREGKGSVAATQYLY